MKIRRHFSEGLFIKILRRVHVQNTDQLYIYLQQKKKKLNCKIKTKGFNTDFQYQFILTVYFYKQLHCSRVH